MKRKVQIKDEQNNETISTISASKRKFCTCPSCETQITVGREEKCMQLTCPHCGSAMGEFNHQEAVEPDMNTREKP